MLDKMEKIWYNIGTVKVREKHPQPQRKEMIL